MFYRAKVIESYRQTEGTPLSVKAGDALTLGERSAEWPGWIWGTNAQNQSGWVPEVYLDIKGSTGFMLRDYAARELTVNIGDELLITEAVAEWLWAEAPDGETGWVPQRNTQRTP